MEKPLYSAVGDAGDFQAGVCGNAGFRLRRCRLKPVGMAEEKPPGRCLLSSTRRVWTMSKPFAAFRFIFFPVYAPYRTSVLVVHFFLYEKVCEDCLERSF